MTQPEKIETIHEIARLRDLKVSFRQISTKFDKQGAWSFMFFDRNKHLLKDHPYTKEPKRTQKNLVEKESVPIFVEDSELLKQIQQLEKENQKLSERKIRSDFIREGHYHVTGKSIRGTISDDRDKLVEALLRIQPDGTLRPE